MQLDSIDWKILGLLQGDARMSNVELAKAVGLSPSPCLNRVRTLEEAGYISRYVTLLDALRVGLKVSVFIQVTLERQIESALERFENAIRARPEVMECYLMTGDADYLIRVVVADIQELEAFILKFLTKLPGVGNIKSSFALKQVKKLSVNSIIPFRAACDAATEWCDGGEETGSEETSGVLGRDR